MNRATRTPWATLLIACVLSYGCQTSGDRPSLDAELAARFQKSYLEPYKRGELDAWMAVFAEGAVALHDGVPPLEGKTAIRGFGAAVMSSFSIDALDAEVQQVRRSGDWAWMWGLFEATFVARTDESPPGVAGSRNGKFSILWERQQDGQWLVIKDMGNRMPPPVEP